MSRQKRWAIAEVLSHSPKAAAAEAKAEEANQ
jgi:small subunit ribosomal protein S17